MRAVAVGIRARRHWHPLDAVLFPAGFFRLKDSFGPFDIAQRMERLVEHDISAVITRAARSIEELSNGVLLVLGIDTPAVSRHWNGDQLVVVFNANGPVTCLRKIFPCHGDTDSEAFLPFLVHGHDLKLRQRMLELPSGGKAIVDVCYDAFLWAELRRPSASKRAALRYLARGGRPRKLRSRERDALFTDLTQQQKRLEPRVHLVALHGFRKPGRELYWQRHGLASASAAHGGALVVGAAHFKTTLPRPEQSPLAAAGVPIEHLKEGGHRRAHHLAAVDSFYAGGAGSQRALVRLFEA